jgi:hypothetical protein
MRAHAQCPRWFQIELFEKPRFGSNHARIASAVEAHHQFTFSFLEIAGAGIAQAPNRRTSSAKPSQSRPSASHWQGTYHEQNAVSRGPLRLSRWGMVAPDIALIWFR